MKKALILISVVLISAAAGAQSTVPGGGGDFLRSPAGIERGRHHPNLRGIIEGRGLGASTMVRSVIPPAKRSLAAPEQAAPTLQPCNNATGTKFNLEPDAGMAEIGFPVSQNDPSVDFIPGGGLGGADLVVGVANDWRGIFDARGSGGDFSLDPFGWGFSGTGYYVARRGGCGADFEGGLPRQFDITSGDNLYGLGEATLAIDATRGNVFAADVRGNLEVVTLVLFRTTATRLTHQGACPSGTHLNDKEGLDTTARACWPFSAFIGLSSNHYTINERPHMRTDERVAGQGAGDLYLAWRRVDWSSGKFLHSILMAVCTGDFKSRRDCSEPFTISGPDVNADLPAVAILPNGTATITYVEDTSDPNSLQETVDIKHVSCLPAGAPSVPKCSSPSLVATETHPLYGVFAQLTSSSFPVATYPSHDVRTNAAGNSEEIVAWARCKQDPSTPIGDALIAVWSGCPDTDVVFTTAHLDSQGTPRSWGPVRIVNGDRGDQFFPGVAVDRKTGTTRISYYSSAQDPAHHRLQLMMSTLRAGAEGVEKPQAVLSTLNEPGADAVVIGTFFGNRMGIASRNGRTYIHGTFNNFGTYNGNRIPGQDNVLSVVDEN